ncbi:hypothetical protein QE390_005113 [Siphonobacter sp. SORGH_AS 1065]|nr:hypothetical protein [Siphonobacter sp. SORGH_AS_1065]
MLKKEKFTLVLTVGQPWVEDTITGKIVAFVFDRHTNAPSEDY